MSAIVFEIYGAEPRCLRTTSHNLGGKMVDQPARGVHRVSLILLVSHTRCVDLAVLVAGFMWQVTTGRSG